MVDTNDVHGMSRQVANARENLESASIDDRDKEAITAFADHRQVNEGVATSTLRNDIADTRRLAERAESPLVDFESIADANAVLMRNETEFGLQPRSNDKYRKAIRNFFGWLDDTDGYGESFKWWDDVTIPARETKPIDPDDMLSTDEVRLLRETADHPREKALIEFLADTGMRIAAALQLKRGYINDLDTRHPVFKANPDGEAQKGIDTLPRPIIQSGQQLRVYLNDYHPDDHPEAAVFAAKDYDHRDRSDGAIHPTTTLNDLKDTAEECGIERNRVSNHAFRHVATTRMRRDMDMDWDDIAHRTDWSAHSLSRMKEVYEHLSNSEKNDRIWKAAGREVESDESEPIFTPCVNCGVELPGTARICSECGADQDAEWVEERARRALGRLPPEKADAVIDAIESVERD